MKASCSMFSQMLKLVSRYDFERLVKVTGGSIGADEGRLDFDAQGIRIRLGRTWGGLPWTAVHHVEHTPRRGLLRDGRLVVVPHNLELIESEMTGAAKRHTTISRMLHGAPLAAALAYPLQLLARSSTKTLRQTKGGLPDEPRRFTAGSAISHQLSCTESTHGGKR